MGKKYLTNLTSIRDYKLKKKALGKLGMEGNFILIRDFYRKNPNIIFNSERQMLSLQDQDKGKEVFSHNFYLIVH